MGQSFSGGAGWLLGLEILVRRNRTSCTDLSKIIYIEIRYANKYSRVKETCGEVREMLANMVPVARMLATVALWIGIQTSL
jgi:hypothetical protein